AGQPGIQSAVFADNILNNGENTTILTVATTIGIAVTDFNFRVTGTAIISGNSVLRSDTAILKIVDFTVDVAPASQTIAPGQGTTYTVTVTRLNGLTGAINLVTDLGSKQYIQSAIFDDSSLDLTQTSTILRVETNSPAPDTTIGFGVTGTVNVGGTDLSHNDTASLILITPTIPDFTISVTPDLQTVDAGNSTTYTVAITRLNNFTDTVVLTSNLLTNFSDYIAQATFGLTQLPLGIDETTLSITTKTILNSQLITFTVTGTALAGSPIHSDTADLQINVVVVPPPPPPPPTPDFTISVTPDLRTVDAGAATNYTVAIIRLNNFSDTVILTHNLLSDFGDYIADVSFDSLQLFLGADETTMYVTTKDIANSQLITFAVTGTALAGSPIHADDADLQINVAGSPPPTGGGGGGGGTYTPPTPPAPTTGGGTEDFTVQVTPITSTTIYPGESATYQITLVRLGGFTGPVALSTNVLQLNYDVASATFGKTTIPAGETTTTLLLVARPNAIIDSSTIFNVTGTSTTLGERADDAPVAIIIPRGLPSTGPTTPPSNWFWLAIIGITWLSWAQLRTIKPKRTK
ncbi:TPA: hypothetical protein DIV45_00530, partial [Patescibacteria group bacterium]|nr:hypothetical protein [Patescibacteria group bacterium]